jgi:hypothetical protein
MSENMLIRGLLDNPFSVRLLHDELITANKSVTYSTVTQFNNTS